MGIKKIFVVFSAMLITTGLTSAMPVTAEGGSTADYTLIWSDEFDGTSVNMDNWSYELGNWMFDENGNYITNGWGNNEQEFYTDSNATVKDGILTISAKHEPYVDPVQGSFDYTSSKLLSINKFSTCGGRIEVRSRCDSGKSLWPAIWMLPEDSFYGGWAASGEIDIMEGWGSAPEKVCGTLHFGDLWPDNKYLTKEYFFENGDSTENWHTYAIEWDSGQISWFVDDVLYSTQTEWYSANRPYPAPFDQNFYIILNLAVGGHFDGVNGIYGDPSIFANGPQNFQIDYVRVYKNNSSDFAPAPIKSTALKEYMETSVAVMRNKDGYTQFDIADVGKLEYGIMGAIPAQEVKVNEKWRLSFGISSTADREAVITVEDSVYNRYLDKKINITAEKQMFFYDVVFEADMPVDIKFQLGNIGDAEEALPHRVIVSDIKWEKVIDSKLKGDVNSDGKISAADLVTLSKWLLGNDVPIVGENSDLNDDGFINVYDFIGLRKLVIGE